MTIMVERVTKAIMDKTLEFKAKGDWLSYEDLARAAIAAMRVPTDRMIARGCTAQYEGVISYWQAMIDAALEGK